MSTRAINQTDLPGLRIKKVFEYLRDLNNHRNPAVRQVKEHPWHFWLDHLPNHPNVELRVIFPQKRSAGDGSDEIATPPYLFRVRRPKLTPPPSPPSEIQNWVQASFDDPEYEARFHPSQNRTDRQGETVKLDFDGIPARPAAFAVWKQKHDKWRQTELPARRAMSVFEKLYALHGKLEREAEAFDLVIGDGLLSWQRPEGSIYHPLLVQRVQLVFDDRIPEFQVVDADGSCELCTHFLIGADLDGTMLAARKQELDNGAYHPLSLDASAFLQGFVNHLSSQGTFLEKERPEQGSAQPTVGRAPLLLLRSRTKGYGDAIEKV